MAWKKGEKIPTNLITGFLGSGKTTAIKQLIDGRPRGETWSIFVNEFGTVSIDHALVDTGPAEIAVEKLGGGCACCTLAFAFKPLLAKFIRQSKPDRLILEPSGLSHPAKVIDILRSPDFAGAIDLRNTICLVDPKDFEDPRWKDSEVFCDQIQLADIVVLNWIDSRDRELISRCLQWIESFTPPKQLILETSHGAFDLELLDRQFEHIRHPIFADAHPAPEQHATESPDPEDGSNTDLPVASSGDGLLRNGDEDRRPAPRRPLRFENNTRGYDACGWIFHVDDIFDRDKVLDLTGSVNPVIRLKGVFRCRGDWWVVNRAKDGISFAPSTYRRDSRLEVILDNSGTDWSELEARLLDCLSTI